MESQKLNHRIWTSIFDVNEWDDYIKERMEEGVTFERACEEVQNELIPSYLDDERMNMGVDLPGRLIAIADMGLWWGRTVGVRKLGTNLSSCFAMAGDYDDSTFFCDEEDLRATLYHHDGRHEVILRLAQDDVFEELENLARAGALTIDYAVEQTDSVRLDVQKVYGFE
jgi:hypothetical protein